MQAITTWNDDTLIRRAVAGETECFTVLVQRHLGGLKNHVRSMLRSPAEVDDVVQEVLLKAWLHLPAFRFECSFRGWMNSIATNEVLQSYRRQRRRGFCQSLDDINIIASPGELPLQRIIRVEREQVVRRAIFRLPTKYRQVLHLRYFQQRNERETARILESSTAAVKSRLFRARQMLGASLRIRFDVPERSNRAARQDT